MALAQHLRKLRAYERKHTLRSNIVRNLQQERITQQDLFVFAKATRKQATSEQAKAQLDAVIRAKSSEAFAQLDLHEQHTQLAAYLEVYTDALEAAIEESIHEKAYAQAQQQVNQLHELAKTAQAPELLALTHALSTELRDYHTHSKKQTREELIKHYQTLTPKEIAELPKQGFLELTDLDKAYTLAEDDEERRALAKAFAKVAVFTHPASEDQEIRQVQIGDWQLRYNKKAHAVRGIIREGDLKATFAFSTN